MARWWKRIDRIRNEINISWSLTLMFSCCCCVMDWLIVGYEVFIKVSPLYIEERKKKLSRQRTTETRTHIIAKADEEILWKRRQKDGAEKEEEEEDGILTSEPIEGVDISVLDWSSVFGLLTPSVGTDRELSANLLFFRVGPFASVYEVKKHE